MPADRDREEYVVQRGRARDYDVLLGHKHIGFAFTLWGAKRVIRRHRRGEGAGTIAHREKV